MNFDKILETWYLKNKRNLPWRNTKDPYKVWLSEIILQQTRVQQGLDYYLKFIDHYPTVQDLANANEDDVLKDWQGLGYYSRARNLHTSAQYITNELNGEFPATYKDIIKLKGVGDYTASAVAAFCFNEKTTVVDGNVYRVLARYFNIDTPINSTKGIKYFKRLATELLQDATPSIYNQAIMEYGALVCTPQNPNCMFCVVSDQCQAFAKGTIKKLPVKEKKIKIKKRYFNFIVFDHEDKTIVEKRTAGIWKNLYQFPLIETSENIPANENSKLDVTDYEGIDTKKLALYNEQPIEHKLSHQHLFINFWIHNDYSLINKTLIGKTTPWNDVEKYAVPKPIANFLTDYKSI